MENKKPGKEKLIAWIGLALGALALFLVVYTQWLGPAIQKNAEEMEQRMEEQRKQEAEEAEKEAKEAEWRAVFSPEEGWTKEDYDRAMKDAAVQIVNQTDGFDSSLLIDSAAELQSLKGYDVYIVDWLNENSELNRNADLVVRYVFRFDEKDTDQMLALYFKLNYGTNGHGGSRLFNDYGRTALNYLISEYTSREDLISYIGHTVFLECSQYNIDRKEGSLAWEEIDTLMEYLVEE